MAIAQINQAPAPVQRPALLVQSDNAWLDSGKFSQILKVAQVFADASLVPEHFRNNLPNCIIAVQMAARLEIDPFMFMQKAYVVHGRPGIEAQLKIALANARGPFSGPIQWRFEGTPKTDNWKCTAYTKHTETGELCEYTIDWPTVKAEGWLGKSGSKWSTMPEKMMRYRSASWLIDLYCPEVCLGMMTVDEAREIDPEQVREVPAIASPQGFASLMPATSDAEPATDPESPPEVNQAVPAKRKRQSVPEGQQEIPVVNTDDLP